jgi:putative GTP pyrophosphokinase
MENPNLTPHEYYGNHYDKLKNTKKQLLKLIYDYRDYNDFDEDTGIQHIVSRIKTPESAMEKLQRKGYPTNVESALKNIHDVVGIRIVCAFLDDVYEVAEWIRQIEIFDIVEEKDYIKSPKENGYRSLHFLIVLNQGENKGVKAEIQIRTIAIDFWATLEHKMKYKRKVKNPELVEFELKRCADEACLLDKYMQELKSIIEEE